MAVNALTPAELTQHDQLAEEFTTAYLVLSEFLDDDDVDVSSLHGACEKYNLLVERVNIFKEAVVRRLQDEWDDKDEKWLESEASVSVALFIEEWNNFEATEVEEDEPTLTFIDDASDDFFNLPRVAK